MVKACSYEGCPNPVISRGWCRLHYDRLWRSGELVTRGKGFAFEHFVANLMTETPDCKLWPYSHTGGRVFDGYGQVKIDGKYQRVHVLACAAFNGPRPPGMQAAHGRLKRCVSTLCWNGAHLSWKTVAQNNADMERDGTRSNGGRRPSTMPADAVLDVIARYAVGGISQRALASEYGVHRRTIQRVVTRRMAS